MFPAAQESARSSFRPRARDAAASGSDEGGTRHPRSAGPRRPTQRPSVPPPAPRGPPAQRPRASVRAPEPAAGGGVCRRHMGRPPPIGRGRLTRPRAHGHAGGAGRAEATPPGTSGAAGAGSHDPGPRHPPYKPRGVPRAQLRAVRAGTSCASSFGTPSVGEPAGGRPSARYAERGAVPGAGQPASVGSAASMPTPVGSAALPTPVGPAQVPSAREDPGTSSWAACARTGSGNLRAQGARAGGNESALQPVPPARCPQRARPRGSRAGRVFLDVLAMKESTASRVGLPFLGNELGRDRAFPAPFSFQESPSHSGD